MDELDLAYSYLLENNIASEETLRAITGINGYTLETLRDILFYFTGYTDINNLPNEYL